MVFNTNTNKFLNFILSLENIYILFLIILNILNLCIFYKNKHIILINGLILLGVYFYISERKDKKVLILSILHFSLYGVLTESFIIYKSGLLKYKDPLLFNVPLWLIPIYCLFTITAIHTYEFFKLLI